MASHPHAGNPQDEKAAAALESLLWLSERYWPGAAHQTIQDVIDYLRAPGEAKAPQPYQPQSAPSPQQAEQEAQEKAHAHPHKPLSSKDDEPDHATKPQNPKPSAHAAKPSPAKPAHRGHHR